MSKFEFCKDCTEKEDCKNGLINHCDLYSDYISKQTKGDNQMSKYIPSINKKNPMWTRCTDYGSSWTKRLVKKRCPDCGVRGSLLFFYKYNLAHCPMCAHIISTYSRRIKKYIVLTPTDKRTGLCPLCGSDVIVARQSIVQTEKNEFVLDVKLYKAIYNSESAIFRRKSFE